MSAMCNVHISLFPGEQIIMPHHYYLYFMHSTVAPRCKWKRFSLCGAKQLIVSKFKTLLRFERREIQNCKIFNVYFNFRMWFPHEHRKNGTRTRQQYGSDCANAFTSYMLLLSWKGNSIWNWKRYPLLAYRAFYMILMMMMMLLFLFNLR